MLDRTRTKCLAIRDSLYPRSQWPGVIHEKSIEDAGRPDRVCLEIGCGREATRIRRLAPHYRLTLGIDMEIAEQSSNGEAASWFVMRGDAHHIPTHDASIDVIATADVIEHLADPSLVFRECMRVLKPGGIVIVSTVNAWFPPILLGRMLPHRVRQWINRVATDTELEDTFRTYYRANSGRSLIRSATSVGLRPVQFEYLSHHPRYFMFSVAAYRLGVMFERVVRRYNALRGLRHYLHAVFQKPEIS